MPRFIIFLVGLSAVAVMLVETMKEHPELLSEFFKSFLRLRHSDYLTSRFFSLYSRYGPDEYERKSYYHGVTGDGDDPELVYRSDYSTTPVPKPSLIWGHTAVRSLRGVFDTPLNSVWDTVGPQIRDLIKARGIHWSSIDPARFFTHGSIGEEEKGRLGPVVVWVGVIPGSTSPDTAHDVSQEILALLLKNGVEDVVVEWREAVLQRLAGPPLMRHVVRSNGTNYVRRFLTALLGVPIAAEEVEEDVQGTLTLWFHENKDKDGNPSDKVYGVSNCHVLRKNTTVDYEHRRGASMNYVRVCGSRRFQRGLDEIAQAIAGHAVVADHKAREIVGLEAKERHDTDDVRQLRANRRQLDEEKKAITQLESFHDEVCKNWSHVNLHRNIGYVQFTAGITTDVEGGTQYTSDWGAFLAAEAKVKPEFEGNVIDLGSKYSVVELTRMFCARLDGPMTFKYPGSSKLQIVGCATKEDLANPAEFDRNGQCCLIVGKDGNSTDLTVGCYAGLVSFIINEVGVESVELGIYNTNHKTTEVFSDKGDSGFLVWHSKGDKAHMVGQLHSGSNKGGLSSNHVTYCTPGWFLLEQIRKRFKYADFYKTAW
ncbi:hypothetical protein AGABI2DRAFT_186201 [Agaricus bisporus var. bisporus H97]|uniref:hypothetical protein n=1 Tax=Agaricus bisporus var. bisporus (strain H97 / ATCC MYA-4626 / FGSC 10389) TaxID=936046 RepID=UPI00029F6365|nr:hypothetical protein AGABI2DRAFT_186201 [Agaricus bisporus var. bisporus H97]EKV46833.1 hypothetical protein AGABI2DRAFT_186201 [Agaricus bisporus var. bisporus H97]